MNLHSSRLAFAFVALTALAVPATAGTFESYHPDQYYFAKAVDAFDLGRVDDTARFLRQSARYGDKTAQIALCLLARDGVGRSTDLAEAYAWADVAGERGYPMFLAVREAIWLQLAEADQAHALEAAKTIHAEYGDAVAKPRLERLLRAGRAQQTGTRAKSGSVATGVAQVDSAARAAFIAAFLGKANPGGIAGAAGGSAESAMTAFGAATGAAANTGFASTGDYYDDAHWEPALYWYMRDAPWMHGRVTVRALRVADAPEDGSDAEAPTEQ